MRSISWIKIAREPAAHESLFCEPHAQVLRALNQTNRYARAEVVGKVALMNADAAACKEL
jgi:hypothetical protein